MARVPQVGQQAIRSVQGQAPGVVPFQDQTGRQLQQVGRGLQMAGTGVQQLGDEIQEREDNARIKEADALFAEYVRGRLNPNDGYRSRLGKSAGDDYEQVRRDIEAKRRELDGTLRNDVQRSLFGQSARMRMGQAQSIIDGHAAQQTQAYEMAETAASIEGRKADYQASLGDPRAMAMHMQLLRRDVAELAEMRGVGPKVGAQMLQEQETAMHASALDALIGSGDTASARDYFNAAEKSMTVAARERARGIISKAEVGDRAQSLMLRHSDKSLMDVLELSDKQHAEGKISDQVRAEWVRRAERRTLLVRNETNLREAQALQRAQEMIAAGPLPPDVQQELEDTDQQWKLDAWLAGDGTWKTSEWGFRQFWTVTDQELAEFKSADEVFNHYRAEMSDKHLGQMVARWHAGQAAIGKAGEVSDKDLLTISRDRHLRKLYRERNDIAEDLDPTDINGADYDRWSVGVEERAAVLMKEKNLGVIDALNEAAKQMETLQTVQGKSLHNMTTLERQGAKIKTTHGTFDVNLATPERLQAAAQKLNERNNQLIAEGLAPVEITEPMLYEQAHADVLIENATTQEDAEQLRQRGLSLLRQRFRMLEADPEVQRQIRREWVYSAGGVDVFGRPRKVQRVNRKDGKTPRQRLMEMALEKFGEDFGAQFGLSENDIGTLIRVESGEFVDRRPGRGDVQGGAVVDPNPINRHVVDIGGI